MLHSNNLCIILSYNQRNWAFDRAKWTTHKKKIQKNPANRTKNLSGWVSGNDSKEAPREESEGINVGLLTVSVTNHPLWGTNWQLILAAEQTTNSYRRAYGPARHYQQLNNCSTTAFGLKRCQSDTLLFVNIQYKSGAFVQMPGRQEFKIQNCDIWTVVWRLCVRACRSFTVVCRLSIRLRLPLKWPKRRWWNDHTPHPCEPSVLWRSEGACARPVGRHVCLFRFRSCGC